MPVDTSFYRYQPPQLNALADFWKPLTGQEIVGTMQAKQQIDALQLRNRLLFMEEAQNAEERKAEIARREFLIGQGIPGTQATTGSQMAPPPPPQNALAGPPASVGPPAAPGPPPGWHPPMALPEGQPAAASPTAPEAPAPYSPEAWGRRVGQEELLKKHRDEALATFNPVFKAVVESGDQEAMDALLRAAKKNPALAPMVNWVGDPDGPEDQKMKITGKGESETTSNFTKEQLDSIASKAASPIIKKAIEDAVPGQYKVKSKGGKIVGFEPAAAKGAAYPIGHVQAFQVGRNMVYKEYMGDGKWKERPDLGGGPKDLPPQVADDFAKWTTEEKKWHFDNFKSTGVKPDFGWGRDAARSRAQFQKEYAAWNLGKGVTGAEAGSVSAEYKALSMSLRNQEKIRGMMGGFVRNMDKQVVRLDDIFNKIVSRVGVRALDYPLREIKTRAIGSGNEAVIEAYLLEISNEIGKLSTGSAASIQELSIEAQKKWAKIHDPNLSPREIKKVLTETRQMGQMRLESSDEEIKATQEKMKNIDKEVPTGPKEEPSGGKVEPRKPGESIADYLKRTKK